MNKSIFYWGALAGLALTSTLAHGQPADVLQMYQECTSSGGRAAATYQAWVAQNGCICGNATTGNGQRRCSSSASVPSIGGGATNLQQLQLNMAGQVGNAIGTALGKAIFGDPSGAAARNAAAAQEAQMAALRQQAEEQRVAALQRQQEEAKQRILGALKDTDPSGTLALKTGDSDAPLALKLGDAADTPPLKTGNQTAFFGSKGPQCAPSQAPSVVDLCGHSDTVDPAAMQQASVQPAAITINPVAPGNSGVGLTTGPADTAIPTTPASADTAAATAGASPPASRSAAQKQEPEVTAAAMAKLVPLLRQPSYGAGGPLPGSNRPAICESLSRQLDEIQRLARRAVLANDVYVRYSAKGRADLLVIGGFDRISDDRTQMKSLLPGMADRSLLDPPGSDYRAAIYRDRADPMKIFLVFRGSTLTPGDWVDANGPQAAGLRSDYYAKAIALTKVLKKNAEAQGMQLELLGHSLGGGMADAASVANRVPATTFNPSGVNPSTLPPGTDLSTAPRYATDYVVDHEPLNAHQDHPEWTEAQLATYLAMGAPAAIPAGLALAARVDVVNDGTTSYAKQGVQELGALASASLPPAIGRRVTLAPDPQDFSVLDPFKQHYMLSVLDAIMAHSHELYGQYVFNGCGT